MEGIPQHMVYKEGIKLKKLIMLKEIKAIKKQIEKLDNSMSGKTDDFKITKKKELLNLYKKLFRNKLMNENINVVEDLYDAGWTLESWFEKEKKLFNTYYDLAEDNAKTLEQLLNLGNSYSYNHHKRAKKVLNKANPLCKNFEDKWKLGMTYIGTYLNSSESVYAKIGKKICNEAINLLDNPKEIKEYQKDLAQKLSPF